MPALEFDTGGGRLRRDALRRQAAIAACAGLPAGGAVLTGAVRAARLGAGGDPFAPAALADGAAPVARGTIETG